MSNQGTHEQFKARMSGGRHRQAREARETLVDAAERWLVAHRPWVLGVVVGASVLVRAAYFVQLNAGPCVWQHCWEETDMHFFDAWARQIAAGDWLTDQSLHPHLGWHRQIAASYFRDHPREAAAMTEAGSLDGLPADPSRALWDRWYGGKRLHQEPLYPYLIALTYKWLGPDVRWVFAWQMLLGVLTNVLIYWIARRHFGDSVALVAAVLAVLCAPLLYREMLLLRETVIVFAGLGIVFFAEQAAARGTWRWWLLAGLASGIGILLKSTFFLLGFGLLCLIAWRLRKSLANLARSAAALAGGVAICLLAVLARNLAVGSPPLALESVGALAFICANAEDYPPQECFFLSRHVPRILGTTGGRMLPSIIETLRTHGSLGSYLRQLWGKLESLWHWYEKPNNSNFYYYRLHAPVLRFLPVTFCVIAPLSIVGLLLAAPRFEGCASLFLLVASSAAPLLLFYVLSRFRAPLLAALLPFAALAVARGAEWIARKHWGRAAALFAALVALSLWTMRPLSAERTLIRPADYAVPYGIYYDELDREAQKAGDWRRAADILGKALRHEPPELREIGPSRPAQTLKESQLAAFFAKIHQRYAGALAKSGEAQAASGEERRAMELAQAARRR